MNESLERDRVVLPFPSCLEADFPSEVPLASAAVERVLNAAAGANLEPLARRSPALAGNDWSVYLQCSIARMAHVLSALSRRGVTHARILDVGSYFGNVSLMLATAGHDVHAVDSYRAYEGAFGGVERVLAAGRRRNSRLRRRGLRLGGVGRATIRRGRLPWRR